MGQKIKPDDRKFEAEAKRVLRKNKAKSPDTAMGRWAVHDRIKEAHKSWIFGPMRTKDILDDLVKKRQIKETKQGDKYYLPAT